MQSDYNHKCVKSAASLMGHGHVLNLNSWIFKTNGTVLSRTSCAFDGHLGQFCNCTGVCGNDDYKEVHHQLFHKARSVSPSGHSNGIGVEKKEELLSYHHK